MSAHKVFWTTPSPFWEQPGSTELTATISRPAVLRFATDDFMNEYATILNTDPRQLLTVTAANETWDKPHPLSNAALLSVESEGKSASARNLKFLKRKQKSVQLFDEKKNVVQDTPITLYQPIHQRYYLISACLLCRSAGLGDHILNTEIQEKVGFVVRRLFDDAEYAYVKLSAGTGWKKIDDPGTVTHGEERLPLFPVYYTTVNNSRRRLFTGFIPVGRINEYAGAQEIQVKDGEPVPAHITKKTGRMRLFQMKVAGPWRQMVEQAAVVNETVNFNTSTEPVICEEFEVTQPPSADQNKSISSHIDIVLELSRLLLFDYAGFLKDHCPDLWKDCVIANNVPTIPAEKDLISALLKLRIQSLVKSSIENVKIATDSRTDVSISTNVSLLEILKNISSETDDTVNYPLAYLNSNVFTLTADALTVTELPASESDSDTEPKFDENLTLGTSQLLDIIDKLTTLTIRAMPENPPDGYDFPIPLAAQLPLTDTDNSVFVLRCVFERPMCGEILQPPVVSYPTEMLKMAGFFHPDAPARPIRIGLPSDTSPAGLRKYAKNTAFMISSQLCGQIQSIKKMTFGDLVRSVLPWPFHKDLKAKVGNIEDCAINKNPVGMMCSLSIPIVTLCALILLIMIVTVLDYIFKWLPFLIICFPMFKPKTKETP